MRLILEVWRYPPKHLNAARKSHYNDVIMTTIASEITSLVVVYSAVYSDADQRKHQSSASLGFVWGIHRDRWIPRTKGQLRGKCLHLMTSSCLGNYWRVITCLRYRLQQSDSGWQGTSRKWIIDELSKWVLQYTKQWRLENQSRLFEGSPLLTWITFNPSMDK